MLSLPGYGHFVNIITIKVKMVTICDEHKRRLMDQIGIAKTLRQKALRLGFLYPNFEVYREMLHQKGERWSHPHLIIVMKLWGQK